MATSKSKKDPGKLSQAYPPTKTDEGDEPESEQEEEPNPEQPPVEEPPAEDPEKRVCDVVGYDGTCSNCGWKWGDPNPHPVHVMPQNITVPVEAIPEPPPAPVPPEPDPKACSPVYAGGDCPKCGWTAASGNPHPVF